jgi:hypothetical protein
MDRQAQRDIRRKLNCLRFAPGHPDLLPQCRAPAGIGFSTAV